MYSNINFIVQFFIISKSIPWNNSSIELCVTSQEISSKFQKRHLRLRKKHLTRVRYYIKSLWAEENHWLSDHFAPAALLCKLRSKTENKYFLELILASLAGLSQPFMS